MKTIRSSCFETNSSSAHTIVLGPEGTKFTSFSPDDDGVVRLGSGEYGWGYDTSWSAETKADYCAIDFQHDQGATDALIKLIIEQTGAKQVDINVTGYIDHQSQGTAGELYANEGVEGLRNFIFNPKSVLIIDNDNH